MTSFKKGRGHCVSFKTSYIGLCDFQLFKVSQNVQNHLFFCFFFIVTTS